MTNEQEWEERWEKFSETVSADFIQPGFGANEEVKEFIKEEKEKSYRDGQAKARAHYYKLVHDEAVEETKAELLSKIEDEVKRLGGYSNFKDSVLRILSKYKL